MNISQGKARESGLLNEVKETDTEPLSKGEDEVSDTPEVIKDQTTLGLVAAEVGTRLTQIAFRLKTKASSLRHIFTLMWSFLSVFGFKLVCLWSHSKEPVLDVGKIRIRWHCHCGLVLWDDYKELRPGAGAELRKDLESWKQDDAEGLHYTVGANQQPAGSEIALAANLSRSSRSFADGAGTIEVLPEVLWKDSQAR